jgi:nucleoside-diphosphate-sugar epimerase
VAVIGAAGFVGRGLCARLVASGIPVIAIVRAPSAFPRPVEVRVGGALSAASPWPRLLDGAGTAVHLASRAHAALPAGEIAGWIAAEAATAAAWAAGAAQAGLDRLVLLSSIKVLGEAAAEAPFTARSSPAPADAYGRAKLAMEQAAREAIADGGPSLAVIRPPLVYGPGVKANFRALLRLADLALPLPLASVANRRSMVALDNLVDLIVTALAHPGAAGGTFLVRDGEDVGTPDLLRRLARHLGRPARLFPFPPALLRAGAALAGRGAQADRVLGSLRVDDGDTRDRLGWTPPVSLDDGLAATCRWYRGAGRSEAS